MSDFAGLSGYTLRPLAAADIPAFLELGLPTCAFMHGRPDTPPEKMRQHFTSFVREYAFERESEISVVKDPAGEVVAQLWLHQTRNRFNGLNELWVWDLTVRADHRQRGLGKSLLEYAQTRAQTKGCAELWLLVSSINDNAVKLYQAVGMGFSGYLMSKPVADPPQTAAFSLEVGILRELSPTDLEQLYKLWEAAGLPYKPRGRDRTDRLSRHLRQAMGGGWGIEQDGRLIAAALVAFDGRKGYIEHLAVHPEFRRAGLARAVVVAGLETLKQAGAMVTAALIESENSASRKLFESIGFVNSPTLCYYSIRDSKEA